jgi:O-antigen/teichoic acid export membrane protein
MPYDSRHTLRTVAVGAFWRLLRYPFLALFFVVIPRLMGRDAYGRYAYFVSILTLCEAFTSLGNLQIFGRFLPERHGNPEAEKRLFRGLLVYGTLFVALFTAGLSLWIVLRRPAAFPLPWLPILISILLAGKVQGTSFAFLYGRNEIGRFSSRELLRSAFTFAFAAGLYALTGSVTAALWGLALNEFALLLVAFAWTRDAWGGSPWFPLPLREFLAYFLFGATFYLPSVLVFFLQRSVPLFIRALTGAYEQVAPFDLANQFLMTTGLFLGLVFTTLVPALSRLASEQRQEEIARWNRTALAWCGAMAMAGYLLLLYWGKPVLILLLGAEFADTYEVASIVGLAFIPLLIAHLGMNYAVVRKKPLAYALSALAGVAAMAVGAGLWIPRWGARGAAWAAVAGHAASALVYLAAFRSTLPRLLPPFLTVSALGLALAWPGRWITEGQWPWTAAVALGGFALIGYAVILLAAGLLQRRDLESLLRVLFRPSPQTPSPPPDA